MFPDNARSPLWDKVTPTEKNQSWFFSSWLHWVFLCGLQALHCCAWAQQLWHGTWNLSPRTRDRTHILHNARQFLNLCTTRKYQRFYKIIFYYFFTLLFYWNITILQCCVSFCWTSWISHMYTYISFLLSLPPTPQRLFLTERKLFQFTEI